MSVETIAIVHHTHIDFGYTDHQQTCFRMHEKYIEDAICAIERTKDYPADSQFRWTQEVSFAARTLVACGKFKKTRAPY